MRLCDLYWPLTDIDLDLEEIGYQESVDHTKINDIRQLWNITYHGNILKGHP